MEIKELDKKQYILLTLLITFVVSIATGIVTVSLMNQAPKSVPQTINNVIQRTIEKVTTVQVPVTTDNPRTTTPPSKDNLSFVGEENDTLVFIYSKDTNTDSLKNTKEENSNPDMTNTGPASLGQGIIISDIGLILVDSNILNEDILYKVVLNKIDFHASVLKKFNNGFTILKISAITDTPVDNTTKTLDTGTNSQ